MKKFNAKVFVPAAQKGGTGKSTLACHAGFYFAEQNPENRVLFVNCETQGNSSKTMKMNNALAAVKSDALFKPQIFNLQEQAGITVIEGGGFLADVGTQEHASYFIQHINRLRSQFTHIVIDTPPTAGILHVAPLIVADFVFMPIELEDYSMDAIVDTVRTIRGVQQKHNQNMRFLGVLPNRVKSSSTGHKEKLGELLQKFPQFMFKPELGLKIGDRQAVPRALGMGIPVWNLKGSSTKEAAAEMLAVMAELGKLV